MKVLKAVLGWANPETSGPKDVSLRMYSLDRNSSPRWDDGGRTIERALVKSGEVWEGDRFLIVRVGDRFRTDDEINDIIRMIEDVIE